MKGIGTDIIEIKRIKEIKYRERFVQKILSEQEQVIYNKFINQQRKDEFLAGRWALKEAIYKAATAICLTKSYKEFSILNDESGAPYLAEPHLDKMHLSLSHCKKYTVAFVVWE